MASAAERQRRYRAHHKGDHSLCDPARGCDGVTVTDVARNDAAPAPSGLGNRGRRLWRDFAAQSDLQPTERVLLEEACRLADRLDALDRLLRGDEDAWLRLRISDDGSVVQVVVDRVLAEARQQQVALKQLLSELRQARAASAPVSGRRALAAAMASGVKPAGGSGGSGIADLTARIAERRSQTAG